MSSPSIQKRLISKTGQHERAPNGISISGYISLTSIVMENIKKQMSADHFALENGEQIIWKGRPGKLSAPKGKSIGAVMLGVALALLALSSRFFDASDLPWWYSEEIFAFISDSTPMAVLIVLSIAFCLYPIIVKIYLNAISYVVTDRRIIISATRQNSENIASRSGFRYEDMLNVYIVPQGNFLCNLHIELAPGTSIAAPAEQSHRRLAVLYLPQEIAEYICSLCENDNH